MNQEENITSKIQAIHDCLGNDAKYLTEDEETQTYYLLGGKSGKDIFNTINNKDTYDNKEETVDTRQYYINFIIPPLTSHPPPPPPRGRQKKKTPPGGGGGPPLFFSPKNPPPPGGGGSPPNLQN